MAETARLTNDISPESTPGAGRRRARTPHSFPHIKYTTQMSVPDQAELDRLRQRINFTDLDEVRATGRMLWILHLHNNIAPLSLLISSFESLFIDSKIE